MTRRTSLRAQARAFYRERASAQADATTPTLTIPLSGGRNPSGEGAQTKQTALTQRARRLYEETAVPVREIAAVAGVTERTLYKYARKGGWHRATPGWTAAARADAPFAPAKFAP
jgi:DNA invertase Pin-like site-specific DNA recombinase